MIIDGYSAEDIDRIATEYLNDTESEFEMQDIIELADKALMLEKAIKDIKTEISKQEIEYRKQNDRCGVGLDMALRIINNHIGGQE